MTKRTKNTMWIIILLTICVTIVYFVVARFVDTPPGWRADMINPVGDADSSKVFMTPTPTPRQFQYNKDSDLKSELETVDPKTENSDFEPLNSLTENL